MRHVPTTQGVQQKKLQRDAQARLNEMSDQLRNLSAVDLSGKASWHEHTRV